MLTNSVVTRNQEVLLPVLEEKGIQLFIKREDEIHPFVSGNKFRKLKYNVEEAKRLKVKTLLSFGGAYSNHIAATASFAQLACLKSIGIIRGDELAINLKEVLQTNLTLKHAHENGMRFKFVSREVYRNKTAASFIDSLKDEFGEFYLIPEGGTNELAIRGCEEILTSEDEKFNYICSAIGTGGTISGLINSAYSGQKIIGFPALKGDFLINEIINLSNRNDNWSIESNYHFGGYGKLNDELITFINQFKDATDIPLDPIYTGKMMFGLLDMISKNKFKRGSKIIAIHTGGLQGITGINERLKKKKKPLIK